MKKFTTAAVGIILTLAFSVGTRVTAAPEKASCGLNTGKAATGAPIPIGAVVGKTGPDDFSSSSHAAAAYFKCVNANGGINGRPIDYQVEDDAWNPEQASQVATKLVRDQKVVAMVGNTSFVDCGANEALYEAQNVVVIAGVGVPRSCFFSKNYAPVNAGPRLSNIGAAMYMNKAFGAKTFVCVAANIPGFGQWSCDGVTAFAKSKGGDSKTILVDPASVDSNAIALQVQAIHPDAFDVNLFKGAAIALLSASVDSGLINKTRFMAPTTLYSADIPKAIGPAWNDKLFIHLELEPTDKGTPDSKNWRAIMDTYGNATDPRDTFSEAGYLAARITTETLLKLPPSKITRATVSDALRHVTNFRSDILCAPWYFGPGSHHNANHAGSISVVQGDGFASKEGCFQIEDPELADLHTLEAQLHIGK